MVALMESDDYFPGIASFCVFFFVLLGLTILIGNLGVLTCIALNIGGGLINGHL
jgi:hypothetical protein